MDHQLFIQQLFQQHIFGNHIHSESVLLNVVSESKGEKFLAVKGQNVEGEVDVDRNACEFQCQNVKQIANHQTHKSVDLNVLLIGIQDRILLIIIRCVLIHNLEIDLLT